MKTVDQALAERGLDEKAETRKLRAMLNRRAKADRPKFFPGVPAKVVGPAPQFHYPTRDLPIDDHSSLMYSQNQATTDYGKIFTSPDPVAEYVRIFCIRNALKL